MPIVSQIKQKIRQTICCVPSEVDQNEGPPPVSISVPQQQQESNVQALQTTAITSIDPLSEANDEEEQQEEDWGEEGPGISSYDSQAFVADEDDVYSSNKSPSKGYDEVQDAFEKFTQDYCPQRKLEFEDANLIWSNDAYKRPIQEWNADQETSNTSQVQEAR
ncbi:hypothetical protein BD408DRAFT_1360 [Parasitella parasitica]|nr:hypothetical protein BD408DRAFT_1360 [Parasitella parasitica]